MTKHFSHSAEFAAPAQRIFTVLTDPELLVARYTVSGAQDVVVTERRHNDTDDSLFMTYRRAEAGALPPALATMVRGAAEVTQTDDWAPPHPDGARRATWGVHTKGIAVEIAGAIELQPTGDGTVLTQSGTVTAHVPLLGSLIEKLAVEQSATKLAREWEWLADQL